MRQLTEKSKNKKSSKEVRPVELQEGNTNPVPPIKTRSEHSR